MLCIIYIEYFTQLLFKSPLRSPPHEELDPDCSHRTVRGFGCCPIAQLRQHGAAGTRDDSDVGRYVDYHHAQSDGARVPSHVPSTRVPSGAAGGV